MGIGTSLRTIPTCSLVRRRAALPRGRFASIRGPALVVLAAIAVAAVHAQQKQVAAPVAGYVFDGAALRPISGVPGGARQGAAIGIGLAASAAVVSPQLDSAIVTASDGSLHLFRLSGQSATEVSWNGAPRGPAKIVYSPSGTAAAIYAAGRMQTFNGLPALPELTFSATLSPPPTATYSSTAAELQAMAVSDDAAWLLVAGAGRVTALSSSGLSTVLLDGTRGVALAFEPGNHAAAILNGAGHSFEVFTDFMATPTQRIAAPGLAQPVGLAFSADGKAAVAAAHDGASTTVFTLASGSAMPLDCQCAPSGVSRLGDMIRLTEAGSSPVWLVDVGTARIVFVPARANP